MTSRQCQILLFTLAHVCVISYAQKRSDCETTAEGPASCVPLSECRSIKQLLQRSILFGSDLQRLEASQCGFHQDEPLVCCTSPATRPPQSAQSTVKDKNSLLPKAPDCGTQLINRIVGGERTRITDFPWTVRIQHYDRRYEEYAFHCGGSLINKKYVLTAAHCVSGIPASWTISAVRLGEWDVLSDPDCVNDDNDCFDPVQDIQVEKVIVHEKLINTRLQVHNDIALLRLAKEARMSQTVQPICLPLSKEFDTRRYDGINMFVAGWGQTELETNSRYKLVVGVKGVSQQHCRRQYLTANIDDRQICAGEESGKDSCKGDSGGPLMDMVVSESSVVYYLSGIVSFGKRCGMKNVPGVYTKVNRFGEWILANLEP
ncbi:serine protease easter-like [Wyeomyia smithii]|uniref:serine protease easter-like n=1 Tax=Wyeomyia smithii TaxID=174621 RepID=UPI002467BB83|nr:serine protease easter-like [Wyeomyia smithii]